MESEGKLRSDGWIYFETKRRDENAAMNHDNNVVDIATSVDVEDSVDDVVVGDTKECDFAEKYILIYLCWRK